MKYKGDYQPSELLDPETNEFFPWTHVKPLLDANTHASFSNPQSSPPPPSLRDTPTTNEEVSDDEDLPFPSPPPPGFLDPNDLPRSLITFTLMLQRSRLVPFPVSPQLVVRALFSFVDSSFRQRGKTQEISGRFSNVSQRWERR